MTFTEKQEETIKKMPMIENHIAKSKDGKFLIHRTVITHIKPVQYYQAVMENEAEEAN